MGKKRRDIEKLYPGKKHIVDSLIKEAEANDKWVADPKAPNDKEERCH